MENARTALEDMRGEDLTKEFVLGHGDNVMMRTQLGETIITTINHLVHHRGQLSVYLRLKNENVPSIHGPSADTKGF
ncbi:MAG: DinB family protein [Acidobacteriota bacterium]